MRKSHRIQQPRVAGVVRVGKHTALLPKLEAALQREATRWGVTPSFVLATALSFVLNVEEQPDYRKDGKMARVRVRHKFLQRRTG